MSAPRPDRCLTVLLPGDDPDAAAENPDLNEALHAGRPVVAFWQGDAGGRTKIAVLLGPVPTGTLVIEGLKPRLPATLADRVLGGMLVVGAGGAVVLFAGWVGHLLAG
jgi:hypothetical protein